MSGWFTLSIWGSADDPRRAPVHESDCLVCDLAGDLIDVLAFELDPSNRWAEPADLDGLVGVTVGQQLHRIAAHALHRRLPGHYPDLPAGTGVAR